MYVYIHVPFNRNILMPLTQIVCIYIHVVSLKEEGLNRRGGLTLFTRQSRVLSAHVDFATNTNTCLSIQLQRPACMIHTCMYIHTDCSCTLFGTAIVHINWFSKHAVHMGNFESHPIHQLIQMRNVDIIYF